MKKGFFLGVAGTSLLINFLLIYRLVFLQREETIAVILAPGLPPQVQFTGKMHTKKLYVADITVTWPTEKYTGADVAAGIFGALENYFGGTEVWDTEIEILFEGVPQGMTRANFKIRFALKKSEKI